MPIYEYCCKKCNQVFEEWLKEFDVASMPCPHCDGEGERMISMPSFILKGGGWYATEYGSRGREDGPSGEPGAAPEPASSSGPSDAPFSGVLEKKERPPKDVSSASPAPTTK